MPGKTREYETDAAALESRDNFQTRPIANIASIGDIDYTFHTLHKDDSHANLAQEVTLYCSLRHACHPLTNIGKAHFL